MKMKTGNKLASGNLSVALEKEIELCSSKLAQAREKLKNYQDEKLYVRWHRNTNYYYTVGKGADGRRREHYISKKDEGRLKQLSEGQYYKNLAALLENELRTLTDFKEEYAPEEKFLLWQDMPEESRILTKPLLGTLDHTIKQWMSVPFERSTFPNENPGRFITKNGEDVRSKNELIMANMLCDMDLPYRYECALDLPDGRVFPDFTVLHPGSAEEWYIEFFGMMDNSDYSAAALKKIQKYYKAGLQPRFIMLFDSLAAPLSNTAIRQVLEDCFL